MIVFEILILIAGVASFWLASVMVIPFPLNIFMYICASGLLFCGFMLRRERVR